jgi:hypothetical protein
VNNHASAPAFAHRRTIDCQTVQRGELEATLLDFKEAPFPTSKGNLMPGEALHHLRSSTMR